MNNIKTVLQLQEMLIEERGALIPFLTSLERYARGLDMMARAAYMDAPAGSQDEANAAAIKTQTGEVLRWINKRADEMRVLMNRRMPTVEDDAPLLLKDTETVAETVH